MPPKLPLCGAVATATGSHPTSGPHACNKTREPKPQGTEYGTGGREVRALERWS